jgi:hypothetical protein
MLHLSAANRRVLRLAVERRDSEAAALLRRRQRLIDIDCFSRLLDQGLILAALKHAHCGNPARLLRHARAVVGATRRRFRARAPAPPSAARPARSTEAAVPRPSPPAAQA